MTPQTVRDWWRSGLAKDGANASRRSTAEKWVAANVISGGRGGKRSGAGRRGRTARAASTAGETAGATRVAADTRKKNLEAERLELELAKLRGELLKADEVRRVYADFGAAVHRALHESPSRDAAAIGSALGLANEQVLKLKGVLELLADEKAERLVSEAARIGGAIANGTGAGSAAGRDDGGDRAARQA